MSREDFQPDKDFEELYSKRDEHIDQIAQRIYTNPSDIALKQEFFRPPADLKTAEVSEAIAGFALEKHPSMQAVYAEAMAAGMNFAYWAHIDSADERSEIMARFSLQYTAFWMKQAQSSEQSTASLSARYEADMMRVEARAALEDNSPTEKALVEFCADRFAYQGRHMVEAFRSGYGFMRHAATSPYTTLQDRIQYDLDRMGITGEVMERFDQYCRDSLLYDTSNVIEFHERREQALSHLKGDEIIKRYFMKGQRLSLQGGICKIINSSESEKHLSRYQRIGGNSHTFAVSGTFRALVGGTVPPQELIDLINTHEDAQNIDDIFNAGLYIWLDSPYLTFEENDRDGIKLKQTVLIPLNFAEQKLVFLK